MDPQQSAPGVVTMTRLEQSTLRAMMARVLPSADGPGAEEAHAIDFARWLFDQETFEPSRRSFSDGLVLANAMALSRCGLRFDRCGPADQDRILESLQSAPQPWIGHFFSMVVRMTLSGFLCAPEYGGNKDAVGWNYVGLGDPVRQPHEAPNPEDND